MAVAPRLPTWMISRRQQWLRECSCQRLSRKKFMRERYKSLIWNIYVFLINLCSIDQPKSLHPRTARSMGRHWWSGSCCFGSCQWLWDIGFRLSFSWAERPCIFFPWSHGEIIPWKRFMIFYLPLQDLWGRLPHRATDQLTNRWSGQHIFVVHSQRFWRPMGVETSEGLSKCYASGYLYTSATSSLNPPTSASVN